MPYKMNQLVDEREFRRHNAKERNYMKGLRERGLLIEIDNIAVDAEQLVLRTFQCNSDYCVRCTGNGGAKQFAGSCCTDLQVDLTADEKQKLLEMAKLARRKLNLNRTDPLNEIVDRVLRDRFTEIDEDDGELSLLHRKSGRCVLSWMDGGTLRCSINTLTDRLGISLTEYKPDPCYLFPLHYSEFDKGHYILSVLSSDTRDWIDQHACVGKLKCLRVPEPGAPPAHVFLRGEIEHLLGKKFYRELDRLAQPILEDYFGKVATNGRRR